MCAVCIAEYAKEQARQAGIPTDVPRRTSLVPLGHTLQNSARLESYLSLHPAQVGLVRATDFWLYGEPTESDSSLLFKFIGSRRGHEPASESLCGHASVLNLTMTRTSLVTIDFR